MFFKKRKSKQAEEQRRHYRRAPTKKHALTVKLRRPNQPTVAGDLVDASAGGAAVAFTHDRDPMLDVGQALELVFNSLVHGGEVVGLARVTSDAVVEGTHRYGFEFTHPELLFQQLDAFYAKFFNRRRARRVRPALDSILTVDLIFGPGAMEVRINDISEDGLGVVLDGSSAQMMSEVGELEVAFVIPKSKVPVHWHANPIHLSPLLNGVVYGVAFDPGTSAQARAQRQALAEYVEQRKADIARWNTTG